MTEAPDQEQRLSGLMRSAQRGDAKAYAALLTEVTPLLRRSVRGRLPFLQAQDVEDLVQDTLLSLHAARATYDAGRPFLPWLMAIARNRVTDGIRRFARKVANEVGGIEVPETFAAEATNMPRDGYGDEEALRQAMGTLPPGQRQAVELLKLRELSLSEAAAASGATMGALKVAAHRGIAALRKALSKGSGNH